MRLIVFLIANLVSLFFFFAILAADCRYIIHATNPLKPKYKNAFKKFKCSDAGIFIEINPTTIRRGKTCWEIFTNGKTEEGASFVSSH